MQKRTRICFSILLAFLGVCHTVFAQSIGRLTPAFDKASPERRLPSKGNSEGEVIRPSPDGQYVARITIGDGEVGYLTVFRIRSQHKGYLLKNKVSKQFEDVNGCIWVPNRPHTLLISSGGADYGEGFIALWNGSGKARILRRAKSSEGEGFNIRGITADSRTIVYEHFGDNSPDPNYHRDGHLRMLVPNK